MVPWEGENQPSQRRYQATNMSWTLLGPNTGENIGKQMRSLRIKHHKIIKSLSVVSSEHGTWSFFLGGEVVTHQCHTGFLALFNPELAQTVDMVHQQLVASRTAWRPRFEMISERDPVEAIHYSGDSGQQKWIGIRCYVVQLQPVWGNITLWTKPTMNIWMSFESMDPCNPCRYTSVSSFELQKPLTLCHPCRTIPLIVTPWTTGKVRAMGKP